MGEKRPGLTPQQSNYLQQRLDAARGRRTSIPRLPHGEVGVASFGQERIWFLERLEPGTTIYHRPLHLRLHGAVNVTALEQSLQAIVQRHAPLHTTFTMRQDRLWAAVQANPMFHLNQRDLADLHEAEIATCVETIAQMELMRPFDLTNDLMMRGLLLRLAPEDHHLLLTFHHIASDGWSDNIFLHELGILYSAFVEGRPSPLPALSIQYADFAAWQREQMQGESAERHLSYWRGQLADLPPLDLPTDRLRPTERHYQGALHRFTLPQELATSLRALAQQEGVTLYMMLLAAFQILLYRYTGQEDIAVGTPIANRTRPEIEDLIGLFINTLVMRIDFSDNPTFRSLLQQVRRTALEGYDHQDLPFEKLVDALRPERHLNRHPLFDVMFQLANPTSAIPHWPGLKMERLPVTTFAAGFDLAFNLREDSEILSGTVVYSTDLFKADTIQRLVEHYQTLLQGIVADLNALISTLSLLSESERRQILVEWNDTDASIHAEYSLHQLFETQVDRSPDEMAVIYTSQSVTYAELNTRANRIAHFLRSQGVGPEIPVVIYGAVSLAFVAGMLGILKAGGIHVPVDSSLPPQRLRFILEDTGAPILLTTRDLGERLPDSDIQVVFLDDAEPIFTLASAENPENLNSLDNAAYIIYTSGSTGLPKGVVVEHRSICHYLKFKQADGLNGPGDRSAYWGSISFDVSMSHVCGPLVTGGILILAPDEARYNPTALATLIREYRIESFDITSSMLAELADQPILKECENLRTIITGSEVLLPATVERILGLLDVRLINGYGPTEATVSTLHHECRRGASYESSVPIGRPIANTWIYILDKALQPVPIGVAGELYLSGVQLARGYLNAPELTAEKFVPDPFGQSPGARMYRTGDRARWLPDGEVDFLGRVDHQVKIRGVRIELGEIEANLRKHPAVRDALVSVDTTPAGNTHLVAYLLLHPQASITAGELRRFLKLYLPVSMLPTHFVTLDAFPLTHTGKLNRQALPSPDQHRMDIETAYTSPRTPLEAWMAETWAALLGQVRVGIDDDFFELGGHSLLIMQFLARIYQTYGVEIPVRTVFASPTIAELSSIIIHKQMEAIGLDDLDQLLSAVETGGIDGEI